MLHTLGETQGAWFKRWKKRNQFWLSSLGLIHHGSSGRASGRYQLASLGPGQEFLWPIWNSKVQAWKSRAIWLKLRAASSLPGRPVLCCSFSLFSQNACSLEPQPSSPPCLTSPSGSFSLEKFHQIPRETSKPSLTGEFCSDSRSHTACPRPLSQLAVELGPDTKALNDP